MSACSLLKVLGNRDRLDLPICLSFIHLRRGSLPGWLTRAIYVRQDTSAAVSKLHTAGVMHQGCHPLRRLFILNFGLHGLGRCSCANTIWALDWEDRATFNVNLIEYKFWHFASRTAWPLGNLKANLSRVLVHRFRRAKGDKGDWWGCWSFQTLLLNLLLL